MPSAQQWRSTSLCTCVLFCWMIMNRPFLVEGEFSCYIGSVDIVNGELRVASTKSIVVQQCSPPTTQQSTSPTTGVNSTVQTAAPQSSKQTIPPSNTSDNVTTPSVNNTNSSVNSTTPPPGNNTTPSSNNTTPSISTTPPGNNTTPPGNNTTPSGNNTAPSGNNTTPGNSTTSSSSTTPDNNPASASPEAPSENPIEPGISNETTTLPLVTGASASTTPGLSSAATSTTPTGESSLMGCVVNKAYQSGSRDNMTVSFSCPGPNSTCEDIGFNGSTGAENRTQCCVGDSCNTIDSFIMRENVNYSKVDSCFVGTTDANETQCGDSSNMCLTITNTMEGDNATAYYCGNETLQSYCEQDGALREGSFKQEDKNITVSCCGSPNCNTPSPSSTPAPSSMTPNSSAITNSSTATPPPTATPPHTATPPPTATPPHTATPPPTATPPHTATPGSTATPLSTGAPKTSSAPLATAKHSNKILIIGVVAAFVVGILGGAIVTVIICRRRNSSAARPGELLAFDNFHYKRMGADEVNEEVFMS